MVQVLYRAFKGGGGGPLYGVGSSGVDIGSAGGDGFNSARDTTAVVSPQGNVGGQCSRSHQCGGGGGGALVGWEVHLDLTLRRCGRVETGAVATQVTSLE